MNKIYTFDINTSELNKNLFTIESDQVNYYKNKADRRLTNFMQVKDPNYKMIERMEEDPELIALIENVPHRIISYFRKIYKLYEQGEWGQAKIGLQKILKRINDGPTQFLIHFISEYNCIPPPGWKGVREIC